MTAVFVHGVPDSHHLWDLVIAELGTDDAVAVDLPGFGVPVPDGFTATKEEYADWLVAQVEAVGEPVDIVGHDWGSLLVQRLVSTRPELVRTWVAGGGPCDETYEWHDTAKIWQTAGDGEAFMETFTGDAIKAMAQVFNLPESYTEIAATLVDDRMKDCILRLYRSAVDVGKEWGPDLANAPSKALIIYGADDPFVPASFAQRAADASGGEALVLDGCGHWWPLERPGEVAAAIRDFWS